MDENRTGDGLNEELAEVAFDLARGYCKTQRVHMHWLADKCRCNPTTFSNYLNDNRPFPAALVPRMTLQCRGYSLINLQCRQSGGVFIPVTTRGDFGTGAKAYRAAIHFVKTSGKAAEEFFKSLEDGEIDEVEYKKTSKWISQLAESVNLLRQAFDEMPITKASEDSSDDLA